MGREALGYPVRVECGISRALWGTVQAVAPAHRFAMIVDATVAALYADRLRSGLPEDRLLILTVPPGEQEKSREQWSTLSDRLLEWGAGRDTTVVAMGGGVVCDLAGFVAATFMRGIPVVHVPTTLLAMVDASIGGKTGVDTAHGKNLIGAFHDPSAVLMDPDLLGTLPLPVFRSGLAEMLKHGVLADAGYFDALSRALPELSGGSGARSPALPGLIVESIAIKAGVVANDAQEKGRRQVLNFGHTIAHAIEQVLNFGLLHGEAVAIGMIVESAIAEHLNIAEPGLSRVVRDAVQLAALPTRLPGGISLEAVVAATHGDKKARGGKARYALPIRVGAMSPGDGHWSTRVPDEVSRAALAMFV